jgi:hypothetical protein
MLRINGPGPGAKLLPPPPPPPPSSTWELYVPAASPWPTQRIAGSSMPIPVTVTWIVELA